MLPHQPLSIAGRSFHSRLILGTGKFASPEAMRDALEASGAEIVTVALRRADLSGRKDPFANILEFIDASRFLLLPNTSGAMNAEEAVRLARLAAAAGLPKWIKLEIHPDPRYLLPDPVETLKAAEMLVKEGFTVLPYINADPVLAKRLHPIAASGPAIKSVSSSSKPLCRSLWMLAWALRAMPPRPWKWAPMLCWSIPLSLWRAIQTGWRLRSNGRLRPAARLLNAAWPPLRKPPARQVR